MRSTLTHWAGLGRRAGLYQISCWQSVKFPLSSNPSNALSASVDIEGLPGSQALPNSITMEPLGLSTFRKVSAKLASHSTYASPLRLPYFFFRFRGNGGEVKIKSTCFS